MKVDARAWIVAGAVAALVLAANASDGAYFSQSWGWVALAFLCPIALTLILARPTAPGRLRVAFAVLMTAFGMWVAASALWSSSVPASLREVERMLVYVALAAAVAVVLRRRDAEPLAAGLFGGIVCTAGYALATRLFPNRLDGFDQPDVPYRLSEPIGYWNALGLIAAIGLLLGLGLTAHARRLPYAAAAAAALPVLAATLYFTFSRGAWVALVVGAGTMVVLDPRRLRLIWTSVVVGGAAVVGVAIASRQDALTTEGAARAEGIAQGHRLAVVIGVLAVASAGLAVVARLVAGRVAVGRRGRRAVDLGLAGAVIAGALVVLVGVGGPGEPWAKLRDRFENEPVGGTDLNERLFSFSGNGRQVSLRVAWDAATEEPVFGHGAGTYESLWYENRPVPFIIRDAHSLYAEVLAELGIVGLVLLGLALLTPLVAAVRARRARFVPGATGAYVTWLLASGLDWHWEMVGVTLTALLAGGVALLAVEPGRAMALPELGRRLLLVPAVGLTLFAVVSLVGNQALFAGREAVARGERRAAEEHGRRAEALLPWSVEPELVLGDAAAGAGDTATALEEYRDAAAKDGSNWLVWSRIAQFASGVEQRAASARVRELNPSG
jgi:O-Antigen ligase